MKSIAVRVALLVCVAAGAWGAELLPNTGFESNLTGWSRNGAGSLYRFNSGHASSWSCRHTGRTAVSDGPYAVVAAALASGGKGYYQASAWIYQASGAAIVGRVQLGVRDASGWTWTSLTATVPHDGWTKVSGLANLTWTGTPLDAWFIVNTESSTTAIYVDDCSLQRAEVTAPTIAPDGGAHVGSVTVTLGCDTPGASIYYTTNGVDPTTDSRLYEEPFVLSASATVKAIGVKSGFANSAVAATAFTVTAAPTVLAPTVTPNGGAHVGSVDVTLACATPDATIGYTLDGSAPTNGSPAYTGPFTLTSNVTVKAIAWKSGMQDSAVASAAFTVAVAAPTILQDYRSFRGSIAVPLACATPGAAITYTTDGSTPTSGSTPYTAPITLTSTTTLKAAAWKTGMAGSAVAGAVFTAVAPDSILNGSFEEGTNGWTVASSDATAYAIGSDHGRTDGILALVLGSNQLAANSSFAQSVATIAGGVYTVRFDYGGFGNAGHKQELLAESFDGAVPLAATNATAYGLNKFGPTDTTFEPRELTFTATSDATVLRFTDLTTAANTVNCDGVLDKVRISGAAATPVISPAGGSYYDSRAVTLSCTTPGASIYYTTSGGTPTASSTLYTSPFILQSIATVKAIAVRSGLADSAVASAAFTVVPAPGTAILLR